MFYQTLPDPAADSVCPGDRAWDHGRVFHPASDAQRSCHAHDRRTAVARLVPGTRHHGQDHRRPHRDVWLGGSPLEQYGAFWMRLSHGDLGVSFFQFPTPVNQLIATALPWTAGLLLTTTHPGLDRGQHPRRLCRLLFQPWLVAHRRRVRHGDPPDALLYLCLCPALAVCLRRALVPRLRRRLASAASPASPGLTSRTCSGTRFCRRSRSSSSARRSGSRP